MRPYRASQVQCPASFFQPPPDPASHSAPKPHSRNAGVPPALLIPAQNVQHGVLPSSSVGFSLRPKRLHATTFNPCLATTSRSLTANHHQPLILHRRMPHRIPTRRIPKMRKHRMYTTLRLSRIHIKLHPPILPRNIPLAMHHHSPKRSRTPASHQMLSPKIITRIHQRRCPNHRQNHPLQNHRRSHSALLRPVARV